MGEMCTKEYRTGYTRYVEPVNTHPLQSTSPISVVPFHNGHTVDECSRADGVRNEISLQESQDDDVQLINNFNAFLCRSQKEITRIIWLKLFQIISMGLIAYRPASVSSAISGGNLPQKM